VEESGYVEEAGMDPAQVAHAASVELEAIEARQAQARETAALAERQAALEEREAAPAEEAQGVEIPPAVTPSAPLRIEELRNGSWVEIMVKGEWVRAQLTWSSPHATLFMFTSIHGTAHSMSRRTLDKLRASGQLKVVADRPLVEQALDQVAQAALKNTLDKK
jgi:hypothetical protein